MKKVIKFSKFFVPAAILSAVLIVLGVVGFFTKGINLGIDFKPGLIEEVTITSDKNLTVGDVNSALSSLEGTQVKALGSDSDNSFQIRLAAKSDADSNDGLRNAILAELNKAYGAENVKEIKNDFIGSSFSKSIASKSILLFLGTVLLIWVYAAFRFHWDFALGSVIALIHDTLIMFTFIIWTQMEFSTTVLAAILTIIGYSINATVVILDRVRFNLGTVKVTKFNELLDSALSDTLVRSVITTLTTLFAVVSLFVFTTGSIKDFACALIVGLLSGCYSSIFISSGFISLFRRSWKPEFGIHHSEKAMKKGVLDLDSGVTV